MLEEILEKAFAVLDLLFGKFEWWNVFKEGIGTAVFAVEASFELSQDEKAKKKSEAILAVKKFLENHGIVIKIPDWLFTFITSLAIDALVGWLNHAFGHEWLKKIPSVS
ncbi:hypothetical protein [Kosmotoga pacifica]|uniref:Uncharacterized protein n=1 Tax=Kosmotoga pacifica TaxID=1330330 RepID=A0A0G2Z4W8_9BACT|nr:hypothetical protein [Kosmotoga pacifica]AKI96597.1 hypothetical protein IX53_00785 [Kosmotoga pacifica]